MKDLTIATFISNNEKDNKDFFNFIKVIQKNINIETIVFTDYRIDINEKYEIKQIIKSNITKYKRIMQLIERAESNNILCIDNDITIDFEKLNEFINEFINNNYDLAWGKIKTTSTKGVVPKLIRIDKNLSHDFIRPFLWKAHLGISIPGQIFMLKRDSFLGELPDVDTVYDDLTLGMIARKNRFKFYYSKSFLGSESPKGNFKNLIKQRIRWSKGMAQSIYNGIKNKMLKFVLLHAFMYHLLWLPYYVLLVIISKNNIIGSTIIFITTAILLAEYKKSDLFWAFCYMLIFPIIHSIWLIFFLINLFKEKINYIKSKTKISTYYRK